MKDLVWYWLVILAIYLFFIAILGYKTSSRRWWGILIDSRNKASLSQFQLVLWTTLIVPLFAAVGIKNGTMNIVLTNEILALLGISLASAGGALIIKSNKAATEPDPAKSKETLTGIPRRGLLQVNPVAAQDKAAGQAGTPQGPKFSDIFLGEEVVDYTYVDISKVQMFVFTLAAAVGYGFVLWAWNFAPQPPPAGAAPGTEALISFPLLSTSLVTLIGISHAGYLAMKAPNKTPAK
jgi:hypothetical protein